MQRLVADGCHVFAGGFSFGVREVMDVPRQLEIHGLGQKTVEAAGIDFIMGKTWEDWPAPSPGAVMLFGNPRCTGFSCTTAGHDEAVHGAWSAPTKDIHDLCHYGVKHEYLLVCWESVQQAMSVGRELLDYLRDKIFVPNGYRIAHLMLNAASFGNPQHRKRYFFMAYKAGKPFNIQPPPLLERHATCGDVLFRDDLLKTDVQFSRFGKKALFGPDHANDKTDDEWRVMPHLPQGWDLNRFARDKYDVLEKVSQKYARTWRERSSDMPFSMHSLMRVRGDGFMPVISSSAGRFVHPTLDRTLTLRELSLLMGWPEGITPVGEMPIGQIGKGIVPAVGKWLAQQAELYANDAWGGEDWESSYYKSTGQWHGDDSHNKVEKSFLMTDYCPEKP